MGECSSSWPVKVGYPNDTYQILYIDTHTHAANYTLRLDYNVSAEYQYDFLYLVGGGSDSTDPAGCNRSILDNAIAGVNASTEPTLLASWTGSILTSSGGSAINTLAGPVAVVGSRTSPPQNILNATIQISSQHRALYFVFKSDERFSHEDGLWCQGKGVLLDSLATSDNGLIYSEQPSANAPETCGTTLVVSPFEVSARVPPAIGALWSIRNGAAIPSGDLCVPAKDLASEHFFFGGDQVTDFLVPGQFNSVVGCPWPVPSGLATVRAVWNEYLDLPRDAGYVRFAEFRIFSRGSWSRWTDAAAGGGVHRGANQGWRTEIEELADCAQADSVQLRYTVQCVRSFAADQMNCSASVSRGLLLDDLQIQFLPGTPTPTFGVFPGSIAQTTFVDGTIRGDNCSVIPCWPGIRGTGIGAAAGGIDDNVNSSLGDSMTVSIRESGLRSGRMINWRHAFDKCIDGGRTIAYTNPAFVATHDVPRLIYRLFDPATKTWSPYDSSELDVDVLSISPPCSGGAMDSIAAGCNFRWDWPPRDKLAAALPGVFTINGISAYSQLAFLPHGVRLQYYYKGVDNVGGATYQFRSDQAAFEVADLPTLPGSAVRAPDIMEFDVLPGVYPAGMAGSLLAGRTNTPILNLDAAYTTWGFGQDPVTYALRGLGVRADRYRLLQGLEEGNNVGGHELAGSRVARLSDFFPNFDEYSLRDSLASWYRILIVSSHVRHSTALEEQDAVGLQNWLFTDTGTNGGDRCILATGDDFFNYLLNSTGESMPRQINLSEQVFGVAAASNAWSGTNTNQYPLIDDQFSNQSYLLDGGCPNLSRFDALTKIGPATAANIAFYPGATQVAGVDQITEMDNIGDNDRNKALGYGFSLQFIRRPGSGPTKPGSCCAYGGLRERLRLLYTFLTSCRGTRTSGQTTQCWPCPADTTSAAMFGNWASNSGFQTATYGPLYPIQDPSLATAVGEDPTVGSAPFVNFLGQNRPNPFNPETAIPYTLAVSGRVTIRIFDIGGRSIRTIVDSQQSAGPHVARWRGETDSGRNAASGIYFYKITYPEGNTASKKMTILR
jgi:hypothetical protein